MEDRGTENRQIMGRLGSQARVLGVRPLFSHTPSNSFPFLPPPIPSEPCIHYPRLAPSLTKIAIRERSDIDDLWLGKT